MSHRFDREELVAAGSVRFSHERRVRLQDVDAAGVVFFARYLEFFHDVLMEYLAREGFDWAVELASGVLAPIKHAEVDYLGPLRFGETYRVELVDAVVGPDEATVGFRLSVNGRERPAAVGQTVHVAVKADSFERARWDRRLHEALAAIGSGAC